MCASIACQPMECRLPGTWNYKALVPSSRPLCDSRFLLLPLSCSLFLIPLSFGCIRGEWWKWTGQWQWQVFPGDPPLGTGEAPTHRLYLAEFTRNACVNVMSGALIFHRVPTFNVTHMPCRMALISIGHSISIHKNGGQFFS